MINRSRNNNSSDQTRFAAEEPMFENITGLPPDENPQMIIPKKPLLKRKSVIISLIIGTTVFVLLILFMINVSIMRNRTPQVVFPTDAGPDSEILTDNPLHNRVVELKRELRSADPNQVKFVFPSVSLQIEIDKSK